ncbi:MAG: YggT family protein [Oceanococcaceae bacterium]
MSPLDDATLFLVNTLFGLYGYAMIARVLVQSSRGDFYNPLAQSIWRVTNPVSQPAQRVIPRWRRWDLASIVVLWLLLMLNIAIDLLLLDTHLGANVPWFALLKVGVMVLTFYTFAILILAVMSWFGAAMHSPAASLLHTVTNPLLRPVRARIPPIGGLDLSPLLVILVLQVLARLLPLPYVLR